MILVIALFFAPFLVWAAIDVGLGVTSVWRVARGGEGGRPQQLLRAGLVYGAMLAAGAVGAVCYAIAGRAAHAGTLHFYGFSSLALLAGAVVLGVFGPAIGLIVGILLLKGAERTFPPAKKAMDDYRSELARQDAVHGFNFRHPMNLESL